MVIAGKMEVTIKITELPDVTPAENNWMMFEVECNQKTVSVSVKPKVWKKLTDAAQNFPQWVAAISGKMGERYKTGFVLDEPNIQVFEKKPKAPVAEDQT